MKVAINKCYGGFSPSQKALQWMLEKGATFIKKEHTGYLYIVDIDDPAVRTHPILIECFETLSPEEYNSSCSDIKIIEIPDDVEFEICEYDGIEWVAEKHRTWG